MTLQRLSYLAALAVDWETKRIINSLYNRLFHECTKSDYKALYAFSRRKSMQEDIKRSRRLAERRKRAKNRAKELRLFCIMGDGQRKGVENG